MPGRCVDAAPRQGPSAPSPRLPTLGSLSRGGPALALALLVAACSCAETVARAPVATGSDRDGDGVDDACDVCPDDADPAQLDIDGDGTGWACDTLEVLPFDAAGAMLRGLSPDGTFVVAASEHVLVVSDGRALFTGRLGGDDPALG
jgi:hypothetical protein